MGVLIETTSLQREFGDTVAVNAVSLRIDQGAILALVGPNGAGKTTLLRLIAALLEPTGGTASVDGCDIREQPREVHSKLGFLPDFFGLYEDLTAQQYLDYFYLAYRLPPEGQARTVENALAQVGLVAHKEKGIDTLSRGMKQRLGLARTLLHDPKLLLLDEPVAGLDPGARQEMHALFRQLAQKGKTLVVSSHILAELEEYCSHVAVLDQGKLLFSGTVSEARASAGARRKLRVGFLGEPGALQAALRDQALIKNTQIHAGEATFDFLGGDEQAAQLLQALVTQGVRVSKFGEVAGTIQDSYLALLGKEVR